MKHRPRTSHPRWVAAVIVVTTAVVAMAVITTNQPPDERAVELVGVAADGEARPMSQDTTPSSDHVATSVQAPTTVAASPDVTSTTSPADPGTPPSVVTVHGTATWTGAPDERGQLRVGACPAGHATPSCPSTQSTDVASDGSFTLALPTGESSEWDVAAYVIAVPGGCVFDCEWRGVQTGPATRISVDQPSMMVELSVAARVVDVIVRDSRGEPFDGGGVQATDLRCPSTPPTCRGELAPMFMRALGADGSTRLVLEPSTTYEMHGQAMNTGWSDPAWTNDGSSFWFSPSVTVTGGDLQDGHVFLVDGAP